LSEIAQPSPPPTFPFWNASDEEKPNLYIPAKSKDRRETGEVLFSSSRYLLLQVQQVNMFLILLPYAKLNIVEHGFRWDDNSAHSADKAYSSKIHVAGGSPWLQPCTFISSTPGHTEMQGEQ
jgi:hypothetical protein